MYPDDLLFPPEFCSRHTMDTILSHDATGEEASYCKMAENGDAAVLILSTSRKNVVPPSDICDVARISKELCYEFTVSAVSSAV